jgi:hypothetical protein
MSSKRSLQLLSRPGGSPGELGFKLTAEAREGDGLLRVWLRRVEAWDRNLDPRVDSPDWDVRCYRWQDSAFALQTELTVRDLATLEGDYRFPTLASAQLPADNGDPVHDAVVIWARRVTAPAPPTAADVAP